MYRIRKILYATDFSETAATALAYAESLAQEYQAELIIAHVIPPPAIAYSPGSFEVFEPEGNKADIEAELHTVRPSNTNIPFRHLLLQGDIIHEMLKAITELNCDLVVVGTHGRKGFSRLLIGSVAEQIVRQSPCPVLTVRGTKTAEVRAVSVAHAEA